MKGIEENEGNMKEDKCNMADAELLLFLNAAHECTVQGAAAKMADPDSSDYVQWKMEREEKKQEQPKTKNKKRRTLKDWHNA